jgi:hypothetical protein
VLGDAASLDQNVLLLFHREYAALFVRDNPIEQLQGLFHRLVHFEARAQNLQDVVEQDQLLGSLGEPFESHAAQGRLVGFRVGEPGLLDPLHGRLVQ